MTKAEREKILEVLLSQERVLTLLYDKTFPPRSKEVQDEFETSLPEKQESIRKFTYNTTFSETNAGGNEENDDVQELEREME